MFLTMIKDHVIKTEKARKMITGRAVGLESKKSDNKINSKKEAFFASTLKFEGGFASRCGRCLFLFFRKEEMRISSTILCWKKTYLNLIEALPGKMTG